MSMIIDESRFLKCIITAESLTINKAAEKALWYSKGTYKAEKLARMGYPYSERKGGIGVPYGDPARINVQSGFFYLSWYWKYPTQSGNSLTSYITNPVNYADILALGKKGSTIPRPLIQAIMPIVEFWRTRYLMRGIKDAISIYL